MSVEYCIINDKINLIIVNGGYILEIGNYQFEGLLNEYPDKEIMLVNALKETVLLTAEYYDDATYYELMILPRIHQLKSKLLD